jgi:hypothetical protein
MWTAGIILYCGPILYFIVLWTYIRFHCIVDLYYISLYCGPILDCIILYYIVCRIVLRCLVYSRILHCIVLYCARQAGGAVQDVPGRDRAQVPECSMDVP